MKNNEYTAPNIEIYDIETEQMLTASTFYDGVYDVEIHDGYTGDDSDAKSHNSFDVWE